MKRSFERDPIARVLSELRTGESGLSASEVARRLAEYGENRLPEGEAEGPFRIFVRQFRSPLIFVLLLVCVTVFSLGETADGIVIAVVLLFNAVVGSMQEGRAQNTLRALRRYAETRASVVRDGRETIVPDTEVVPGDILLLREGEKVPADARLLLSRALKADESSLSGESEPVHKVVPDDTDGPVSDTERRHLVFRGTHIVSGSGRAVVVATGIDTFIGGIAEKISGIDTDIPLRREIARLANVVIVAVFLLSVALFVLGTVSGRGVSEMLAIAIALAVSVIPEGLPIVVTLVLTAGVFRMGKRHALVKKLHAVEALGAARVIAVDKTGTITKNELVVREAFVPSMDPDIPGEIFSVSGSGYDPSGSVTLRGGEVEPANRPRLMALGKAAMLSSGARIAFSEAAGRYEVAGDPTEAAMSVFGGKVGFHRDALLSESVIVAERPFDYVSKIHAVTYRECDTLRMAVAGAPEAVLERSGYVGWGDIRREIDDEERKRLANEFVRMSQAGLRVVALAERAADRESVDIDDIRGLSFFGFLGMKDALRPEVAESMRRAKEAGIRVVMITGDFRATAEIVAREAGIYRDGDEVLTGTDIDALSDERLAERLPGVTVFARVNPEHKLRIIEAYRTRGEIVAMTGDGVNDAPSLVAADLGVAMGGIGTEVAKEAADIVLLDDDFGSIISAVEEGRSIYRSVRKVVLYLFSTGIGEVGAIVGAMLSGLPVPVTPAQIIWLNLVTDGFLDVSLGMEPKEKGLLSSRIRARSRRILDGVMSLRILLLGSTMALGTILLFRRYLETDPDRALTASFTTLAVFQWMNAWNCRHDRRSVFGMSPFSNRYLVGSLAVVILLQLLAVYHPFLQGVLHTVPLTLADWGGIALVSLSVLLVEEIRKVIARIFVRE